MKPQGCVIRKGVSNMKTEVFWIHLAQTNPPDQFWQEMDTLPNVSVRKETENELRATELLTMLRDNSVPDGVVRIAFLHLTDVRELLGEEPMETLRHWSSFPVVFFTKGLFEQTGSVRLFGLREHVLPNLDSFIGLCRSGASERDFSELFNQWLSTNRTDTPVFYSLQALDILLQGAIMILDPPKSVRFNQIERESALAKLTRTPWEWYDDTLLDLEKSQSAFQGTPIGNLVKTLMTIRDHGPETVSEESRKKLCHLATLKRWHEECLLLLESPPTSRVY